MTMKIIARTFIVLILCLSASVQAAVNCRSATAAAQGSQTGYQRDTQAAEQTAQKERNSSDILGKCVGGITGVITAPQFPSLSDIFNQIKDKICQIAIDQINNTVNGATNQINGAMNGITGSINGQINNTGIGQIVGNVPQVSGPVIQTSSTQSSSFWSNIWK